MKNLVFTILTLVVVGFMIEFKAQQTPQYTHYIFNHFAINPAIAGSKECMDIRLGYRSQWRGFDGAPTTAIATLNTPVKFGSRKGINTKHGIGGMIEADKTDPLSRTMFQLAYAYHFQLNRERMVSMGMFAGLTQFSFDAANLSLFNQNDPAIISSQSTFVIPEFNPGIWSYTENSFVGLSVFHLTGNRIKDVGLNTQFSPHYFLTYGRAMSISKGILFRPSILFKKASGAPVAIDVNALFDFQEKVTIGLGYRNGDAVTGMIKFNFFRYLSLAYAYDYTTSVLNLNSSNTHEIILGVLSCGRESSRPGFVPCSAYD